MWLQIQVAHNKLESGFITVTGDYIDDSGQPQQSDKYVHFEESCMICHNWMALWNNRISSTTMKLRKSFVKPVMRQNISSLVILWTSTDICVIVHDDLGWKNQTTRYNCRFSATSLALRVIFVRQEHPPIYASCMTISGGRTEQHVVIGFVVY